MDANYCPGCGGYLTNYQSATHYLGGIWHVSCAQEDQRKKKEAEEKTRKLKEEELKFQKQKLDQEREFGSAQKKKADMLEQQNKLLMEQLEFEKKKTAFQTNYALAKEGNENAMISVGEAFEEGSVITQDYNSAFAWYKKAYDAGALAAGKKMRNIESHLSDSNKKECLVIWEKCLGRAGKTRDKDVSTIYTEYCKLNMLEDARRILNDNPTNPYFVMANAEEDFKSKDFDSFLKIVGKSPLKWMKLDLTLTSIRIVTALCSILDFEGLSKAISESIIFDKKGQPFFLDVLYIEDEGDDSSDEVQMIKALEKLAEEGNYDACKALACLKGYTTRKRLSYLVAAIDSKDRAPKDTWLEEVCSSIVPGANLSDARRILKGKKVKLKTTGNNDTEYETETKKRHPIQSFLVFIISALCIAFVLFELKIVTNEGVLIGIAVLSTLLLILIRKRCNLKLWFPVKLCLLLLIVCIIIDKVI